MGEVCSFARSTHQHNLEPSLYLQGFAAGGKSWYNATVWRMCIAKGQALDPFEPRTEFGRRAASWRLVCRRGLRASGSEESRRT